MKLRKIGKSFLAAFLSLCMMSMALTGLTLPAAAATATSGTTGDCTWRLNGTTLTISGNGAMADYEFNQEAQYWQSSPPPWYYSWKTPVTSVIIEDGVTSIGDYAFWLCFDLVSVTIPDSVKTIGDYAFDGCGDLANVIISNSVISIDDHAFSGCSSLTSVVIPDSVNYIGNDAFYGCNNIETVYYCGTTLAKWSQINIKTGNSKLTSATRRHHDYNNDSITCKNCGVVKKSGKTGDCTWTLDGTALTISGSGAIENHTTPAPWGTEITHVVVESGVTTIGNNAFADCAKLESVTLPDSITSIGEFAFYNCRSLTSIILPEGATNIGIAAFSKCVNLTSFIMPNGVTEIKEETFYECFSLENISIPKTVNKISYAAFYDCISLETVNYCGTNAEWIQINIDDEVDSNTYLTNAIRYQHIYDVDCDIECNICKAIRTISVDHIYDGDSDAICNSCGFTRYGTTSSFLKYSINNDRIAITGCEQSISGDIIIPSTIEGYPVTSIGDRAFKNSKNISSITIPNGVRSIGNYAFEDCSGLASVIIPNSVISINDYAFNRCSSLTRVMIPDSVTSIGVRAFYDCSSITSITIPNSITKIRGYVFHGCTSLTSVVIPNSVTSIGEGAFADCSSLAKIVIPDSVTSIGAFAFYKTAYYNDSKNWEDNLLYICNQLISAKSSLSGSYEVQEGTKTIAAGAFSQCIGLTDIIFPDSVEGIGDSAFYFCTSLETVTIGKNVGSIGATAFKDCSNLTSIIIPDSVTRIGKRAFYNCGSLKTVYYCGTLGKWNEISIDSDNSDLTSVAIYYHYYDSSFDMQCNICGAAKTVTDYSFLTYTVDNGEVTITGCDESVKDDIILPSELGGNPVTSIGELAFLGCFNITSILIPDTVKTISDLAFFDCRGLSSVSLSNSVTSIGVDAFSDCASLTSIYYRGSKSDKQNINIDESNTSLTDAMWYYNSCLGSANHKYDNDCDVDCNVCVEKRETNHTYEVVVTTATCTKKGYTTYTCVSCGNSYTSNEIAPLGHTYNKGVVSAPTCTKTGYTTYTCTACGNSYKSDETAPLGHSYNDGVVTAPTCAEVGYTTYTCTACGDSYNANETGALGHSYDNGVVTAPTDKTQGYTTYTCTVCGYNYKDNYTETVNGIQNMNIEATDTSLIVTWDAIAGTTRNILYVKNEAGETIITRALSADRTSVTLSWPNDIEWDKTYTIGIRAKTTKWLDTVYKDAALTVANRIVDVKTQSVGRTIKVDWKAYEGATQYYVYVYKKGEYPTAFSAIEAKTNSVTIINAIYAEVDYEVRVIATKGVTKMKTIDAIPVAARLNVYSPDVFIERGTTPTAVAVSWDEIRGVDKCWTYLTPVNGGETIIRESKRAIVGFYNLTPNTTYNVQLQARIVDANGVAHYSGMSDVLGTISTTDWSDVSLTATASDNGATLNWTAPEGAYEYAIYRSTNGGKAYGELAIITDPAVSSYIDTKAKSGYIYAIIVRLKDDFVAVKSPLIKSKPLA